MKIKLQTDDLIEGCLAGNRRSQKELYELFFGKMMAVCMRYARDRDEARELLNEGFLKAFTNLHKYKPERSLESWIRRIMINNAIDHYRKNKKHRNHIDIDVVYDHSQDESVHASLAAEEIMKLIQNLSPSYRTVFSLYVLEGFSHREISEKLGISEGTSKSNLSKARVKLQKMIREAQLDIR